MRGREGEEKGKGVRAGKKCGKGKRKWTKEGGWRWRKEGKRRGAKESSLKAYSFVSYMKSQVENMISIY